MTPQNPLASSHACSACIGAALACGLEVAGMVWCRQENRHGGTFADNAIDRNRALIFFGKALYHAEAEAGPFVLDLSGEERGQNILQNVRRDASPSISDRHYGGTDG